MLILLLAPRVIQALLRALLKYEPQQKQRIVFPVGDSKIKYPFDDEITTLRAAISMLCHKRIVFDVKM